MLCPILKILNCVLNISDKWLFWYCAEAKQMLWIPSGFHPDPFEGNYDPFLESKFWSSKRKRLRVIALVYPLSRILAKKVDWVYLWFVWLANNLSNAFKPLHNCMRPNIPNLFRFQLTSMKLIRVMDTLSLDIQPWVFDKS